MLNRLKGRWSKTAAIFALAVFAVGGFGVALAASGSPTTGTVTACATATVAEQTIAANANTVGTIPGASDNECSTTTYTVPIVTETTTDTVTTTTPTGPSSVFVSLTGNDSTCGRGDATNPCASFQGAYNMADPGDNVQIESGSYPSETLSGTKANDAGCNGHDLGVTTGCITFEQAPGASVTVAGLTDDADYTRIDGITVSTGVVVDQPNCASPTGPWPQGSPTDVILKNLTAGDFTLDGGNNIVVWGGSYGPHTNGSSVVATCGTLSAGNEGTNILIHGVTLHDYHYVTAGVHMECLHNLGDPNLTVEDSHFINCGIFDILLSNENTTTNKVNGNLIQNNTLDVARGMNDATTGGSADLGLSPADGITVRANSFLGWFADEDYGNAGDTYTNTNVYGNVTVGKIDSFHCGSYAQGGINVYDISSGTGGVACGAGSVMFDNPFVDATAGAENWQLASCTGGPAGLVPPNVAGGYPTDDINGNPRPRISGDNFDGGARQDCG